MIVADRAPLSGVRVACRPALAPVISTELRRGQPDLLVGTADDTPLGRTPALVIAVHELTAEVVTALVAGRDWAWIHLVSSGVDFFPVDLVRPGTELTRSRGAYAGPVAEYVTLAMLTRARPDPPWRLPDPGAGGTHHPAGAPGEDRTADTDGTDDPRHPAPGLFGQHLVVAGLGAIGSHVARVGVALGMRVTALVREPGRPAPDGVDTTCDRARLAEADHLVLALPLTPGTRHLLDGALLATCRPGMHVVNVARGGLIDHAALTRAVHERGVWATLDVTDPEPLPADHPLRRHPHVAISPHIAWCSGLSDIAFLPTLTENLARWHDGRPLLGVVDRTVGY